MTEEYEIYNAAPGSTIRPVVEQLQELHRQGKRVKTDFNGITLYSDTVTMEDAYLKITGKTPEEFEQYLEDQRQEWERRKEEHQRRIPELTEQWKEKGRAILDPDKIDLWDISVDQSLKSAYRGAELQWSYDIIKIIDGKETFGLADITIEKDVNGEKVTFEAEGTVTYESPTAVQFAHARSVLGNQGHSGSSAALTAYMIGTFAKNGKEFVEYIKREGMGPYEG